jgi:hypothetical protein
MSVVSTSVPRGWAALAGSAAAASALAVGELVAGLAGGGQPSPVSVVGAAFIDRFAASLKDIAVALFGTNDKVALVVGIVVVSLGAGAVLGVAASRRFVVAIAGFVCLWCGWVPVIPNRRTVSYRHRSGGVVDGGGDRDRGAVGPVERGSPPSWR